MTITKLKDVPTKHSFIEALDVWLDTILFEEQGVEVAWITIRDTVYSTGLECLGPSTRRHRDWFDENHAEIIDLIGKNVLPTRQIFAFLSILPRKTLEGAFASPSSSN